MRIRDIVTNVVMIIEAIFIVISGVSTFAHIFDELGWFCFFASIIGLFVTGAMIVWTTDNIDFIYELEEEE